MSDTVNNATIMITADASGVEAGLRKVEDATAKTGKSLDNLEASAKKTTAALEGVASTPGMETAGDGAGVAAGRMDKATKSMADSIQRTLATMNSGAKGSAQYYEALANARGLNVNALRPYLDQLDEMTKKSALAADAQRKLDDSTKFLDSLRSRTEGIGKSASELAALRAEQLGVSDAAAEMIQKLREQEEAGESSFGNLSSRAETAKVALLAVAAAAAAAVVAGAALINNAIGDMADLDDMAQKTGSSVESLSKIQKLASVFGEDMGGVDAALTKLSRGMAGLDDDSNKVQKALKTLGVSSRDVAGNLRDPSIVLIEAAKSLQKYNDGAGKTALINDLISKSGADLLPFLNDVAENYDNVSGTSNAAAAAASAFKDQMGFIGLEAKGFATTVASGVLPTLVDLTGAFLDVNKETSTLVKADWAGWADSAGLGIAKAADAAVILARTLSGVWNSVKAVTADVNFVRSVMANANPLAVGYKLWKGESPAEEIKKALAERNKAVEDANKALEELLARPTGQYVEAFRARKDGRDQPDEPAGDKPGTTLAGGGDDAAKKAAAKKAAQEAEKAAKEYEALIDRINGKVPEFDKDYEQNLKSIAAGYKAGKMSLAEYTDTVEKYNKQQPYALNAAKQLSEFQESYSKGLEATSGIYAKRAQDAEAEAARNEELAKTYGMTKSAVEQLEIAELEAQLTQRATLGLQLDQIESLEQLIDAKKRNASAVAAMEQVDAAKKGAEEWKRAADSIESSLTDALLRGFESGSGFGKNFVDTMKNMFNTLVLRPVISAIVNPVAGTVAGMMGNAGGAVGSAGSSAAGSALSSGLGLSGALGAIGAGSLQTAGAFLAGQIGLGSTLSAGAAAIGTGSMAGITAGLSSVIGVLGPIALGIGVAVKAFSRGPKEYTGAQTLNGALGMGGFSGTLDAEWVKKGGWLRSDKEGFDKKSVDPKLSAGLTSAYDAIKASSADFADVLGLNAASIASRSQAIKIALGKDETANQAAIAEFFVGVANTVAAELLPEIGKFQVQGEQASATLQRLAVNFSAVDQILMVMGSTSLAAFGAVGKDSIEARERLVALAGGIEALAEKTTFFNDNFLSQAERIANAQGPLNEKLASLGFAGITTSEQFKDAAQGLVKSGALANEAGAKIYAELLALGPQYKLVSDYLKEASDTAAEAAVTLAASILQERGQLQDELDSLTMTSVQLLTKQRAALDESNRALFDQIQGFKQQTAAAEAATAAAEAAIAAAAAAAQATRDTAASLMTGVDGAYSVLQRVVDRQKKAIQEEISVRTASVQKIESLSQALRGSLDSMSVTGFEVQDRQAAQAQIQTALAIAKASGVLPSADDLKSALSVLGKDSSGQFSTQEDYLRDFYATKNGITDLATITDKTLSAEERSLKALEGQVKRYDDMLEREQEQIDVLKGISTIGLSIEQAIQALHGAMGAAGANPYNSATSQISDAYKSSLGRAPDAAGLSYWQDRAAGGISTEAIIGSIKGSPEAQIQALYKDVFGRPADSAGLSYWIDRLKGGISLGSIRDTFEESAEKKLRGFAVGTNYVPVDMPAQIHQGERIIPAADNRELMRRLASPGENSAVLVAAVERLTEENRGMRKDLNDALYAIAKNTMNTASSLDDALNGEKPLATKVIA
ncbi:DUF4214 domain-containing protein [Oxalobacteraceae sp. CFBP 8753]|nr:DUF4214 domain-containing protein [Oxalobacteraceae sp. CFBP 8753]